MTKTSELVFVPAPGLNHITPAVELAKLILQRSQRISISIHIINVPRDAPKTNAYVESQSRDNPYPDRFNFVTLPPLTNPPDPSFTFFFITVIERNMPLIRQAVEDRVQAGFPKPAGFVVDMFCGGMVDIANAMQLPCYTFFTSGAGPLSFIFYAQSLVDDQGIDVDTEFRNPGFSAKVPGFKNPVPSKVLPSGYLDKNFGCEMLLNMGRKYREMKGFLVNTYAEFEPFSIHALHNSDEKNIPPFYPVGPILKLEGERRGGSTKEENESIIRWLDGQPKSSVVFLCFGSCECFEEEQVKEIAKGLEKSGNRFLWTLPKPSPGGKPGDNGAFLEALPVGFLDRTSHLGKIIRWAPQVEVLAHPAVGGFVSHCGWNSVLESLWFGVPMATWPLAAEHQLIAFMLVKESEIAVEIRMDYVKDLMAGKGTFLVTAEEIEKGVNNLMNMDEKMKGRVKKMSDECKKALQEGGSSYKWLGCFIEEVLSNDI
ncbi:putative UDP-glucose flavonoid 3-O-glucosyltransferase 3 [Silene latifolia]|uniref:putative UDP-glucose flavonoid 3-O-glucosyltransferase 3 n=1 Tax=Silene latifolia TaxID=37657 RepID=UPI003D77E84F